MITEILRIELHASNHWIPVVDRTKVFRLFGCSLRPQVSHLTPAPGCSLTPIASSLSPAPGSLISIESSVGSRGLHTQKDDGLGLSSEFTFPLGEGRRRAADRLTELRDGSIGSFALGDTFGPNLGSFRGREARHKQRLLKRVGIEIRTHLESTRKQAIHSEKTL